MNKNELIQPQVLFKYRDDSERTEAIIKNRQIWLSSPAQLNDPLECRIGEIPEDWEVKTIRKLEEGQLQGVNLDPLTFQTPKQLFSLSERETKRWLNRFNKLSHTRKVKAMRELYSQHGILLSRPEKIFQDMRKRISSVGIFSLSETSSNELMWAHYGSNHHGIAFGFICCKNCKLQNPRHTIKVTYSNEKPSFKPGFKNELQVMRPGMGEHNVQRVSFEDDVFRASISTKTNAWEYEKEWRYVEESHGLFDFPGTLSQAVFGMRMSKERKNHYKQLIKKYISNKVDFFEIIEGRNLAGFEIRKA